MNKKNKGFTLVEVMITTAIIAGLALVIMQINKMVSQSNATMNANVDSIDLKRNMIAALMDKNACATTFNGISIGQSLTNVKNSAGGIVFTVGQSYGEGKIKLTGLVTSDLNQVGSDGLRSVVLNVSYSRTVMGKTTNKNFPVNLRVKAAGAASPILDCFSDTDGLVLTAKQEACASLGGVWDSASITCTLPSCPVGQILQALKPDGTAVCKSPNCVAPQVFQGFDGSGNAICVYPSPVYQ